MIKLFAYSLMPKIGPEFTYLTQAVAQLAFEYGRLVLLTREQKLLESYIENQHVLDEKLQDRKSTRLNSSHPTTSRMPSSA